MSWLKSSDTSALNKIVVAPLTWDPDPAEPLHGGDLVNALYGLAHRCAVWSAGYGEDYFVPDSIVAMMAATDRWRQRAELAARAGYWTRADGGWQLVADSEHLFHIRLKAEIEWEAQRKRDNGNPALTVPVRLRDGDGCRYCAKIVSLEARRGGRAGTYDHRVPGVAAAGPDDLFVACGLCNSTRGADHVAFDAKYPRRPAPTAPYYGALTVELLAGHGITVPCSDDPRPGPQPDHAPQPRRDPAASGTPHRPRPRGQRDTAPAPHTSATRQPAGPRADAATPPPPEPRERITERPDLPDPADAGRNRQVDGVPDLTAPGRVGYRGGQGSGREPSPPPADRSRRRRGRRGTARPAPSPPPPDEET